MATHEIARGLASLGRHGDSVLVHMQPHEVAGLQALAQANGTSLTVNPHTGMPEAFSLGNFFRSLLPTIAGAAASFIPGGQLLAPIAAGALTGAVTNKNHLMGALTGGLGGWGGAGIMNSLAGYGAAEGAAGVAEGAENTAANIVANNPSGATGAITANGGIVPDQIIGANGMPVDDIPALTRGLSDSSGMALGNTATDLAPSRLSQVQSGFNNAIKTPADYLSNNWGKIAMPLGAAALAGMEPDSGLSLDKELSSVDAPYDPNFRLRIPRNNLRLPTSYAEGGLASLYNQQDDQTGAPLSRNGYGLTRFNGGPIPGYAGGGPTEPKLPQWAQRSEGLKALNEAGLYSDADARAASEAGKRIAAMKAAAAPRAGVAAAERAAKVAAERAKYLKYLKAGAAATGIGALGAGTYELLTHIGDAGSADELPGARLLPEFDEPHYKAGGFLSGAGDGMSDSIPATIGGTQPAKLADGEFVIPADVVSHLGNGSTKAGAKNLYKMMDRVRRARTGTKKQGRRINPDKMLP